MFVLQVIGFYDVDRPWNLSKLVISGVGVILNRHSLDFLEKHSRIKDNLQKHGDVIMTMYYTQAWADMADKAFEERHGRDGQAKIVAMVAVICRPSRQMSNQVPTPEEMTRAECLLQSCDLRWKKMKI